MIRSEIVKTTNPTVANVLVVDDHREARQSIADILRRADYKVDGAASGVEALELLDKENYDVVITDLKMPGMSGLEFICKLETLSHGAQVLMVTAYASVETAVDAMRHGAFDYIEKPFGVDQLEQLVARALAHSRCLDSRPIQSQSASRATVSTGGGPEMVGQSEAMGKLKRQIEQIAPTDETVLIYGESGTGKELVAQAIHAASRRAAAPLVSLNCPVLSAQLMESELFGHERGAFTGADTPRTGRFELADGGTILLDEVTEIELPLQAKLLRVLQERTFERVGSSSSNAVDVRVLATTNRELSQEVAEGNFREDLYYRLAVVPLEVVPLRERRDDIPALVDHFQNQAAARLNRAPCHFDTTAEQLLAEYHWPGNVRELQNLITRANVLDTGGALSADALKSWLIDTDGSSDEVPTELPVGLSLQDMERKMIESTLEHFDGHRAKTASALGIGIRTLSGKLKAYGYAPRSKSIAKAA